MKIADIYKSKSLTTSFEVFPPNDKVGLEQVYNCLDVLSLEKPDYISVTYGAGGNTKGRTVEIANRIKSQNGVESVAHLTCIGAKKEEIDRVLEDLEKNRTGAGEKTRTEIDRRGYSLDYINTPNDDLKFTLNLNGAEFDRDVYQHGKQDLFVFPQVMHDFYIGKARLAVRDTETDLKGTFDEKVRGLKVQGEWKYKDKKAKLTFGYEYKKHELDREADIEKMFRKSFLNDEVFLPMILNKERTEYSVYDSSINHGYKEEFQGNLRYINWWDGKPYTWTDSEKDLHELRDAAQKGYLFSRKFDIEKYPQTKKLVIELTKEM